MHLIQDRTKRLRVLAGLLAVGLLLISSAAQAKGNVRVHNTVIDEVDGEWKLKLAGGTRGTVEVLTRELRDALR